MLSVCRVYEFSLCHVRTHVSPDVDVFHSDVEILEVSTEVVSEIDAVSRVAACCSPVGGVSL